MTDEELVKLVEWGVMTVTACQAVVEKQLLEGKQPSKPEWDKYFAAQKWLNASHAVANTTTTTTGATGELTSLVRAGYRTVTSCQDLIQCLALYHREKGAEPSPWDVEKYVTNRDAFLLGAYKLLWEKQQGEQ